jgi:hypothetical protein
VVGVTRRKRKRQQSKSCCMAPSSQRDQRGGRCPARAGERHSIRATRSASRLFQ